MISVDHGCRLGDADALESSTARDFAPTGEGLDDGQHLDSPDQLIDLGLGDHVGQPGLTRGQPLDHEPAGRSTAVRPVQCDCPIGSHLQLAPTADAIAAATARGSSAAVTARPITSRSAPLAAASCGVADRA